jgi:hypothetical protein
MGHPLFPIDPQRDDDLEKEIARVRVSRWFRGTQKWCPRIFGADELRTHEQLVELFGGGTYELIALDESGETIIARRRFNLPGKPLPFDGEEEEEREKKDGGKAAAGLSSEQILLAVMQQNSAQQQQMMGFFATLFEQNKAESRALLEASKADARAMIESAKNESRAFAELLAKSNENQTRLMTEFFNKSLEIAKGGANGGNADALSPAQMFELGGALAEAKSGGIQETISTIAESFKHAMDAKKGNGTLPG